MQLYTTTQAAEILNISLQGVHYRIKNGTLRSVKQNGKTYVYIDPAVVVQENKRNDKKQLKKTISSNINKNEQLNSLEMTSQYQNIIENNNLEKLLEKIIKTKDEQIQILKKSIKSIKQQYSIEIARLQNNNEKEIARLTQNQEKIIEVFSSEIKLLQQAFQEMKNVYLIGVETKKRQSNNTSEQEDKKDIQDKNDNLKTSKTEKKEKNKKKKNKKNKKVNVITYKNSVESKNVTEKYTKENIIENKCEILDKNNDNNINLKEIKPNISQENIELTQEENQEDDEKIIQTLKEMTRPKTIEIKEFYKMLKKYNKTDKEIKELIMKRVMLGDDRFEYDKNAKKLIIYDKDFSDLY